MIPLLIILVLILFLLLFSVLAGRILTQRRAPDPADHPGNHGLAYEDVIFPSRYKVKLRGWWLPAENPHGTVILVHGQNGSMDGDLPHAVPLHQAGYNVLMFNLRAHGTSEGKTITFGVFEKEDLLGAIDFLSAQKGIDQVGVLGFSMGAGVAMIGAALSPKIAVLVLDGVFLRFVDLVEAWLRQHYVPPIISKVFAELVVSGASLRTNTRMFQVSPILWARHLNHVPVLFIHGERDQLVPRQAVETLAADLHTPYEIWVAPDSDHREAFKKHPAEYNQKVLAWLKRI